MDVNVFFINTKKRIVSVKIYADFTEKDLWKFQNLPNRKISYTLLAGRFVCILDRINFNHL